MDTTITNAGGGRWGKGDRGAHMSPWETELVGQSIEGILRILEDPKRGNFSRDALREVECHASAVRICTTDPVCRERFACIQERAALYFSDARNESAGVEIKKALLVLCVRLQALNRNKQP